MTGLELLSIALIVIIVVIAIILVVYFHRTKRADEEMPDHVPCIYCATPVSKDYIVMWHEDWLEENDNFIGVVCGKKECKEKYKKHEKSTDDGKTDISAFFGD